jgi:hypothetical protein
MKSTKGFQTHKTLKRVSGQVSTSGNNTIIAAPGSGFKLRVYALYCVAVTTTKLSILIQSGAGGSEIWRQVIQSPADVVAGANLAVSPPNFLFECSENTLLNFNLSGAIAVDYSIAYWEEPV